MDAALPSSEAKASYSLLQLTRYFLRLGTIGFGGPVALVGYMHRDLVETRHWISEADYELARVEIEAIDDLSFGLGLLARVHKGTTATYQRRKVNDEIWLPAQVTWNGTGRLFLVKRERVRGRSEFSGYRKFTVDTSTTYGGPPR